MSVKRDYREDEFVPTLPSFGLFSRRINLAVSVWLLCLLGLSFPVHALVLSIDQPDRTSFSGTTEVFSGTITNDTGIDLTAQGLFLNFSGFDPTVLSFDQLLGSTDFSIPNGTTTADVQLFDALVSVTAALGSTYLADVQLQDFLGELSNVETIGLSITRPVPEPRSVAWLLALLSVLIVMRRRKREADRGGAAISSGLIPRYTRNGLPRPPVSRTFRALAGARPMQLRSRSSEFVNRGTSIRWINRMLTWLLLIGAMAFSASAYAAVTPVRLYTQNVATSVWDTDNSTVGVQLQISNDGSSAAEDVTVTAVTVQGGGSSGPTTLPIPLGTIDPDGSAFLDLVVTVPQTDGIQYLLTISGTYKSSGTSYAFSLNRAIAPSIASAGPFPAQSGMSTIQDPNLVAYPPEPPPRTGGPNAETLILIPPGPPEELFPPTPDETNETKLGDSPGSAVEIPVNTSMLNAGVPPDPNAARGARNIVLATYNTGISYSTDGGQNFTDVNLFSAQPGNPARTSFFPPPPVVLKTGETGGGLCCDQVVVYLPGQNLFVWLLQYDWVEVCATNCSITQPNRLRIAWAKPDDILGTTPQETLTRFWNAWRYTDLTGINVSGVSTGLDIQGNEALDYPDLAWSDTFLYVGVDHVANNEHLNLSLDPKKPLYERIVVRLSLAEISNPNASVFHYDFTKLQTPSSGFTKSHFVQHAPGRMVLGYLENTSRMRIFTLRDETSLIPAAEPVKISPITINYTSLDPDKVDWLKAALPGSISGATHRLAGTPSAPRDEYVFAFQAGIDEKKGRPQPYIRIETLIPSGKGYRSFAADDVWNKNFTFAMAAVGSQDFGGTPTNNPIAVTLAVGGGTVGYPHVSVGFVGDAAVHAVTASNATQLDTKNKPRFGDYFGTRSIPGGFPPHSYATEVYEVRLNPLPPGVTSGTCKTVGCTAMMRYVEFGRPPIE